MTHAELLMNGTFKRLVVYPDMPIGNGQTDATYDILRELFANKQSIKMVYDKELNEYEIRLINGKGDD